MKSRDSLGILLAVGLAVYSLVCMVGAATTTSNPKPSLSPSASGSGTNVLTIGAAQTVNNYQGGVSMLPREVAMKYAKDVLTAIDKEKRP